MERLYDAIFVIPRSSKFGRDLRCGSIVAGGDLDTHNDVADDKEVLVGGGGDDVLEINFFSFACSNLSISTMKKNLFEKF